MKNLAIKIIIALLVLSISAYSEDFDSSNEIYISVDGESDKNLFLTEKIKLRITQLNKMIKSYPDNFKLHFMLAEANRNINKYEDAVVEYSRCMEINPNDLSSYVGLATIFRKKLNNPDQVIKYLDTFKKYDTALAYYALAFVNHPLEKINKMNNIEIIKNIEKISREIEIDIKYLKKSLDKKPDYAEAHFELGSAYKALAMVYFLNPDTHEESIKLMNLFCQEYDTSVKINPSLIKAHYYLAEFYNIYNDKEKFLNECMKIIEIDPYFKHSPSGELSKIIKDRYNRK